MTKFAGFSEAARLYASNIEVVREMEKAYLADVATFLEAFQQELQRLLAPKVFSWWETKDRNRYWWRGEAQRTEVGYLWFTSREPTEIDHEGLALIGGTDIKDTAVHEALKRLPDSRPDLGLEQDGRDRWTTFHLLLDFEGEEYFETAAQRVANVLIAMDEVVADAKRSRRK